MFVKTNLKLQQGGEMNKCLAVLITLVALPIMNSNHLVFAQSIKNETKCKNIVVLVNDPDQNGTNIRNIPGSLPHSQVVGVFPYNQTAQVSNEFSQVILKGQYSKKESWFEVVANIAQFDLNGTLESAIKVTGYMASKYKNGTPILVTYLKGYSKVDLKIYGSAKGNEFIGKIQKDVAGPLITILGCEGNRIRSYLPDESSGKNVFGWIDASATCPNLITNCN
ncbi:MAG: hypothetical protein QE271_05180 [Bacteriovoracaceae bacterium]|nr:hypothetical protein [Bacteriovoracaceae bacterium]